MAGEADAAGRRDERALARRVMLALSTFRQSDKAVDLAIDKAGEGRDLVVLYVADVNLARYFIGTNIGLYPELQEKGEAELLKEHERAGKKKAESIAARAREAGIQVRTRVVVGRFAVECLKVVETEKPDLIITTRSRRPQWARRFFGSPVDQLISEAGCPVVEA